MQNLAGSEGLIEKHILCGSGDNFISGCQSTGNIFNMGHSYVGNGFKYMPKMGCQREILPKV